MHWYFSVLERQSVDGFRRPPEAGVQGGEARFGVNFNWGIVEVLWMWSFVPVLEGFQLSKTNSDGSSSLGHTITIYPKLEPHTKMPVVFWALLNQLGILGWIMEFPVQPLFKTEKIARWAWVKGPNREKGGLLEGEAVRESTRGS